MKIITTSLEGQRQDADKAKSLVVNYGPLITEVPYKGLLGELKDRIARQR